VRPVGAGLRFFVSVPFAVRLPESISVFVAEMERLESGKLHPLRLASEIEQLMADGYLHVLQMPFRIGMSSSAGSVPLGDGELHIFGKPPFSRDLWRWCRQH
jgi:hypothetical protein